MYIREFWKSAHLNGRKTLHQSRANSREKGHALKGRNLGHHSAGTSSRRRDSRRRKSQVEVEEQSLGLFPQTITVRPFSVNIDSYPVD